MTSAQIHSTKSLKEENQFIDNLNLLKEGGEGETITLWTRQVPQVWEELKRKGRYIVKEEYIRIKNDTIADYYIQLYRWYTREAKKHITLPEDAVFPIWFSVTDEMMLQLTENTIILKVEVPKTQVVIANMEAWGYVVNYWYVPLNEEDAKAHAEELKRQGVTEEDTLISTSKGNFYPLLKQKIISSWSRVFTMPPANNNLAVATTWEIRKEWVKEVYHYEESE